MSTEPPRGNPFFAEELVAAGDGAHLRGILLARFDRLGDDAKAVLRVASAIGRTVDLDLLAELAAIYEPALDAALREELDAHVLVRGG